MIMSLIDYSKYKVQEANFKFWDDLGKKVKNQIAGDHLTLNRLSDNSVSEKKHAKIRYLNSLNQKRRRFIS
ncbi:hypothetical protein MSBRW_2101 [Methanosarcina barkeri str. Wiesmoor]|uniref:Uncharacterized protein n=1 Tax=Methanosarcina barkeri str. Wiesmoor TaxID=1434109 RepID=A0A0E3QNG3_METBA|nr:hypothetical protein MSBRW_2101 [Methanosarcina barkeri str. Wiesmoor]